MNQAEKLSPFGHQLLDKRKFLGSTAGMTMGALGLSKLLASDNPTEFSGKPPIRPSIDPNSPYASRRSHFQMPAKRVLVIYCPGAVSHVDTFDYKPELVKLNNKPCPESLLKGKKFAFIRGVPKMLGPQAVFSKEGESGNWVSNNLPHFKKIIDEVAFLKAVLIVF